MATLHVRNVPDSLYEALRASAEQNGRSIGSQAIALLNESLSSGRRGFPFFGRSSRGPARALQAFSKSARAAVGDAQALVLELGHDQVGGEHILVALLADERSPAARALAGPPFHLTADDLRGRLEPGAGTPPGRIPFSGEAKSALELALRESLHQRSPSIETEHVLLGLAGAGGRAAELLSGAGATQARLRGAILTSLAPEPLLAPFRVVDLEGSAEEWEAQLTDAGGEPYELVEVVGTRAIFRLRRP